MGIGQVILTLIITIIGLVIEYTVFVRHLQKDTRPYIVVNPSPPLSTSSNSPVQLREIKCAKCKTNNALDNSFCVNCGYELYEHCPKCSYRKPKIETHCVRCGKNPTDLLRMDQHMQELFAKAVIIGFLAVMIAIRTFTISSSRSWMNLLSFLIVIPGFVGLAWESLDDIIWLYKSGIWRHRAEWAESTISNITLSRTIFVGIAILSTAQGAYLISLFFTWLKRAVDLL